MLVILLTGFDEGYVVRSVQATLRPRKVKIFSFKNTAAASRKVRSSTNGKTPLIICTEKFAATNLVLSSVKQGLPVLVIAEKDPQVQGLRWINPNKIAEELIETFTAYQ